MTDKHDDALIAEMERLLRYARTLVPDRGMCQLQIDALLAKLQPAPKPDRVQALIEAANICGTLAETTYDSSDAFEAATGCEASIRALLREKPNG